MEKSLFNLENQASINNKIVVGLERISEAFKVLLWEQAKTVGLSPIQIQILIFTAHHKLALCNVSYLAKEFNVTKPTISDAVRILAQKELIEKVYSTTDNRSYSIIPSLKGTAILKTVANFAHPIQQQLQHISDAETTALYKALTQLIHRLTTTNILTVQRSCFGCSYYQKKGKEHFCNLLNFTLEDTAIRLDCPEYVEKVS